MTEASPPLEIIELPEDILLRIFSYLDALSLCKVRRVCSTWNRLSTDEILWKHKLLTDVKSWKHISSTFSADMKSGNADTGVSKLEAYMRNSPEIQTWKKNFYQRTTLHQLTNLLRNLMPTKKFAFGVGASAWESYGKGQSFFSKLLSFDAANVFQHCGQFPGRFKGLGGGFQFKYNRHMLELCLMFVAPKVLRDAMTPAEKLAQLKSKMEDEGFIELLGSQKGYIHSIDARLQQDTTDQVISSLKEQSEEVALLDEHLSPGVPLLVLSTRKVDADPFVSSYDIVNALQLNSLSRPWMVSECSAQMIYRDIVDGMDWLIAAATPLL